MAAVSSSSSPPSTEEAQKHEHIQEQKQQQQPECVHRTKTIQFLGRTTPIVLQNDNGPCPLLAICNVLLLRNNLNLSPEISEVSQEKLLSLVVERLIDSNSNVNNKDAGYVENQQQNIADAMNLLPRLATGIDVNIKFRRIDDFEFTPECAIFDLLDIPLYHGWIVDPQDYETASAIGVKSYNALMGELVALETRNMECLNRNNSEDCVDFAAATTATLGVPSPSLSKTRSFDESPRSVSSPQKLRKGDLEEEAELMRALKLSEAELPNAAGDSLATNSGSLEERSHSENVGPVGSVHTEEIRVVIENQNLYEPEFSLSDYSNGNANQTCIESSSREELCSSSKPDGVDQFSNSNSGEEILPKDSLQKISSETVVINKRSIDTVVHDEDKVSISPTTIAASLDGYGTGISQFGEKDGIQPISMTDAHELVADNINGCDTTEVSSLSLPNADSDSSSGRILQADVSEAFTSSLDGSEPIYEGEECILDSGTTGYEDREPVYEGEVILAEQADKGIIDTSNVTPKDEITPHQGELIRNFLKNNASQLTVYGLFCLQDGLKERELCVFFRNNHFSTMFKYDGQLYLLATDQGYLNQPDLVWEKLNEVNGDTLFMTGSFKEFKVDNHASETWDEHNAMASTADYLASIDSAAQAGLDLNSDLQLAIALQQQEFEQQPQRQNLQQPSITGGSRLVTGPQVSRNSGRNSSTSRPDSKSKDKCIVM